MTAALLLARRFWWIGPIIAAVVFFGLWRMAESEADTWQARNEATEARLSVSNASIMRMEDRFAQVMADLQESERLGEQASENAREARLEQERDREALQERIERLRRPVERSDQCLADDDVTDALEGL